MTASSRVTCNGIAGDDKHIAVSEHERNRRAIDLGAKDRSTKDKPEPETAASPDARAMLALQRAAGNQAVQRMLAASAGKQADIRQFFKPAAKGSGGGGGKDGEEKKGGGDKKKGGGGGGGGGGGPAKKAEPEQQNFVIEGDGHDYTARLLDGTRVGSLTLYEDDDGQFWINNIDTEAAYRRRGIGTLLVIAALADHQDIYASTQRADHDDAEDTRHLEPDGRALVDALIAAGRRVHLQRPAEHADG